MYIKIFSEKQLQKSNCEKFRLLIMFQFEKKKSQIGIRDIAWKRWQGRLWELIEVTNLQPWKSPKGWGRIYERSRKVRGRWKKRWWSLLISWSRTPRCARGGGEPSLASREDPYGSLRMPLSICVILRIYNEDAIHFPSYSSRDTRCSVFLALSLPLLLPLLLSASLSPVSPSSLSHLGDTESTQVPSSSLPSLRSANWRMSWCLTMVIITVPPRTTSAVSQRGWQQQPWFHVIMNLHLAYDDRKIRFLHVENAYSRIISTLLIKILPKN